MIREIWDNFGDIVMMAGERVSECASESDSRMSIAFLRCPKYSLTITWSSISPLQLKI